MQTGGVHKYDLPVRAGGDAQQLVAGRLWVVGYNGDVFADKAVEKARLADIRASQNGNKA